MFPKGACWGGRKSVVPKQPQTYIYIDIYRYIYRDINMYIERYLECMYMYTHRHSCMCVCLGSEGATARFSYAPFKVWIWLRPTKPVTLHSSSPSPKQSPRHQRQFSQILAIRSWAVSGHFLIILEGPGHLRKNNSQLVGKMRRTWRPRKDGPNFPCH